MPHVLVRFALLAPLLIGALLAAGCDASDDARAGTPDRLDVVATIAPVGAVAKAVGGEFVDVHVLVKPGVDPHEFSLRVGDRKAIADADVILRNGIGIDSFLDKSLGDVRDRVTTVSDGVQIRGEAGGGGDEDPHIWQSAENVKVMARNALEAFVRADPAHGADYQANAAAYMARLDEADQQVRAIIESIPPANRKMVTNHDAFGYFIERYGLEFVGAVIPGQTTAAEPSAKDISKLEDTIRSEGVKAIFAESSVDPKVARQLSRDTGVRIVDDLYGDTLGPEGSGAETIEGMLVANAEKIAEALR